MKTPLAILLATVLPALADHPFGGPLPIPSRPTLIAQLTQPESARRAPAIARLRADAPAADVTTALSRAETTATAALKKALQFSKPTDPTFENVRRDVREWLAASDAARALVTTDHHKDKQKFAEMDRAFDRAEKAFEKITRGLKAGQNSPAAHLVEATVWAAQIQREKNWAAGMPADPGSLATGDLVKAEKPAIGLEQFVIELEPFLTIREHHRLVTAAHAQMKSAKPEAISFADLLNSRRLILRQKPLLLGEKLSAACEQHSEEMVRLKYFAHESPVPANKTPWDRVKNARFAGSGGGECIYAGSASAHAAHTGWWYSDGHRLILYSEATAQGIARTGGTWTFMTGSFSKFPL